MPGLIKEINRLALSLRGISLPHFKFLTFLPLNTLINAPVITDEEALNIQRGVIFIGRSLPEEGLCLDAEVS